MLLATTTAAFTQSEPILSRVQVVGGVAGTCPAIFVSFNDMLRYQSHDISGDGRIVSIRFRRDVSTLPFTPGAEGIETYPGVDLPGRGTVLLSLSANQPVPLMVLRFAKPVALDVAQAGENSIVITNIRSAGAIDCGPAGRPDVVADGAVVGAAPGDVAASEVEVDYMAARRAITQGDYPRAIQLLTKILSQGDNERSADAQELIGIARERNGQLAHARAEYETYLAKYPKGPGADRVRQRLAVILTAEAQPPAPATGEATTEGGAVLAGLPEAGLPPVRPGRSRRRFEPLPEPEPEPEPAFRGTVSSYYYRNQGTTVFTEFETDTTETDDQVFEDTLVTSLDVEGQQETEDHKLRWRIAGDNEVDFSGGSPALSFSVSRAYADVEFKANGMHIIAGRQSRSDGGILGRFDGVEVSLPLETGITLRAVAGSPADSSSDSVFESKKLIYGLSATREDFMPNLDATAYFVMQTQEGYTDRQAVGIEGEYQTDSMSINGVIDYDTYFNTLALARVSGTWIAPDQSSVSLTIDHIMSPMLNLSNALTGQTETTLDALASTYSTAEMKQLALDRTTATESITLAYSRPISDKWQLSVDGSVYHTSSSPASGGVPAQAATTEYFASVQAVGSNVLKDRDTLSIALRAAHATTSDLVLLDAYERFEAWDGVRFKLRTQVGYRQFTAGGDELFAVPSVNATYKMNEDTDFELELGARYSTRTTPAFSEESNEFYVTAGVNRRF